MTSEEKYGIRRQPPPTCPMLDEAKDIAQVAIRASKGFGSKIPEDIIENMRDEISYLLDKDGPIERARNNAENIREWGEEWKDFALELQKRVDELERNA